MSDELPPDVELPPTLELRVTNTEELAETYDLIERTILGEQPTMTRLDVVREAGVTLERAQSLWRSMGFTAPGSDEDAIVTDADVEALRLLDGLIDAGLVSADSEEAMARSIGRSFNRLAEYEIAELAATAFAGEVTIDQAFLESVIAQTLPVMETLQTYIWRRHLASAAGRLLLQPDASEHGTPRGVGFADVVGFTRHSRRLSAEELGDLVEVFESTVNTVIAGHGGLVIKTIGDEVLFAADDPLVAGRIALDLADGHEVNEHFPDVRVGVAYGDVLSRLGDVFGEPVNIASRLTSLAKPGRVLMNRELYEQLKPHDDEFRVRRLRTASVKGYSRLETFSLGRPLVQGDERPPTRKAERDAREARREARRARREELGDGLRNAPGDVLEQITEKLPDLPWRDSDEEE